MDPTMDKTRHILNYLIPIVHKANSQLAEFLDRYKSIICFIKLVFYIIVSFSNFRSEAGTIFALSWLITWYGHVLSDPKHILRLYDFFLACHPLMPIYLAAQVSFKNIGLVSNLTLLIFEFNKLLLL